MTENNQYVIDKKVMQNVEFAGKTIFLYLEVSERMTE